MAARPELREQQRAAVLQAALREGAPLPPAPQPADLVSAAGPAAGFGGGKVGRRGGPGTLRWATALAEFRHMRTSVARPPIKGRHADRARIRPPHSPPSLRMPVLQVSLLRPTALSLIADAACWWRLQMCKRVVGLQAAELRDWLGEALLAAYYTKQQEFVLLTLTTNNSYKCVSGPVC